ncbi:hypothetical protein I3760_13G053200, partial [Carya illinoinensis]
VITTPTETKNLHNSDRYSKPITLCWYGSEIQEEESVMAAQKKIPKVYITHSKPSAGNKKICICAPTTHAGSFKCQMHRSTSAPHKSSRPKDSTNRSCSKFDSNKINGKHQLSRFGRAAFAERQTQTVASVKP